jgi:hypothetical protein
MNTTTLALASILYDDDDLQPRCEIDWTLVGEYADAMKAGEAFPPVIVFRDGNSHWLADGFHRVHATRKAGLSGVEAEVREGDRRAAILYAMGANASHGKRRTNADKGRAVRLLLKDSEWSKWSDREIARVCAVSQPFVSKIRKGSSDNGYQMRRFKRGGSEHEMVTMNIGRPTLPGPDGDTDVTALALSDDDYQSARFRRTTGLPRPPGMARSTPTSPMLPQIPVHQLLRIARCCSC